VTVRYGDGRPALDDVNLRIEPGETVALVARPVRASRPSPDCCPRFHDPSAGEVRIDGHPLRSVTFALAARPGRCVFDEAVLFSGSVRENIAFGRPDATDEEVQHAAEAAGAHEFVGELPDGYATRVGEAGFGLSGGQRQRIALARALLSRPRVLVLDDPLSAVDARMEAVIEANLARVVRGRTTLLIAHRASTIAMADRVVVLDAGQVLVSGTHRELLATNQHYRALLAAAEDDAEVARRAALTLDDLETGS